MPLVYKPCNVIMLPTDEFSCLATITTAFETLAYSSLPYGKDEDYQPQHLYIISDDEIKNDDWYLDEYNKVCQFVDLSKYGLGHSSKFKKIIASTDTKLKIIIPNHNDFDSENQLPKIPKSFIKKYHEKGGIDVVQIKYIDGNPKITTGNTISIKSEKNQWDRNEIIDMFMELEQAMYSKSSEWKEGSAKNFMLSWLKERLS